MTKTVVYQIEKYSFRQLTFNVQPYTIPSFLHAIQKPCVLCFCYWNRRFHPHVNKFFIRLSIQTEAWAVLLYRMLTICSVPISSLYFLYTSEALGVRFGMWGWCLDEGGICSGPLQYVHFFTLSSRSFQSIDWAILGSHNFRIRSRILLCFIR